MNDVTFTFEFVDETVENEEGESQVTVYTIDAHFFAPVNIPDFDEKIAEFASRSEEMYNAVHDFSCDPTVAQAGYTSYEIEPDEYATVIHGFVGWFYGYGANKVTVTSRVE